MYIHEYGCKSISLTSYHLKFFQTKFSANQNRSGTKNIFTSIILQPQIYFKCL